ncbi:MAG: adenosylmethionine--8-amino-7-oxononanoate transaminase [Nitrococcus mobilis]|nr:adenosylmethionine--8-amino-7-oxononanoate transaminase [Nitrococcus mobilis]
MQEKYSDSHPNIWYPFTPIKGTPAPLKVTSGSGAWIELAGGKQLLDLISSWWVNVLGHARPEIADAIHGQAKRLEHVIFAGFTHEPAEKLAETLAGKLPGRLNRVFYSDNGSTAVEIAIKQAWQYWANLDEKRESFICFDHAYHGDTFGAMSVSARSLFTDVYKELLFPVEPVPYPVTWRGNNEIQAKEAETLDRLSELLEQNPKRYAAIIIEPLVQGAGGMRMCRPEFLQALRRLSREHDTLLIFDEVMTGFGRTGAWFACERAGVEPDVIALAKGLTGGFLPLAVTVCSDHIYEVFASSDPAKTLFHGHSYTANPLGCAAANATLELLEQNEYSFKTLEQEHIEHLAKLDDHPKLDKIRVTGTIAAMDIKTADRPGYLNQVSAIIKRKAFEQGLLLRPLGNVLYLMPPYCITRDELARAYRSIAAILDEL